MPTVSLKHADGAADKTLIPEPNNDPCTILVLLDVSKDLGGRLGLTGTRDGRNDAQIRTESTDDAQVLFLLS